MTALLRRTWRIGGLCVFFVYELVMSCLQVAWEVITPRGRARPGIIALPLDARSDLQITILANLISLTPGSLSLAVSDDRRVLFVHVMFIDDVEEEKRKLKAGMETKVMEAIP
jgi:multicomponent Na+:H+ antiporter subunit E